MDVDPQDLQRLSDRELINFVHDLRVQIAVSEARLEPVSAFRRRNLKLVRGTLLASGGLMGATLEPLAAILTIVGVWDWIDAIVEDANAINHRRAVAWTLAELETR